ncbi:MAG: hypothetical protein HYY86_00450 [Candidatus Harrisonbacteria bacterium]|nr:hypothetical protein [Candidatus Harrisonbacteria bacterium]
MKIQFLIMFFSAAFGLNLVQAAELYIQLPSQPIYQNDVFPAEIRIRSFGEAINAVQADLNFPANLLEVVTFDKVGSILSLWPKEPSFSNVLGTISMAGGLPNPGFQGQNGLITKIYFRAKNIGEATLKFLSTSKMLLNNGSGDEAELSLKALTFKINLAPVGTKPKIFALPKDVAPPDAFSPIISRTPLAFDGKYFVSFLTEDRESGLERYELREIADGKAGGWKIVTSPYVLENQKGDILIQVKAIDKAGNETIGEAAVQIESPYLFYLIIFLVILAAIFIVRKL